MTALDHFLDKCSDEIGRRVLVAGLDRRELEAGAHALAEALVDASPIDYPPTTVPVVAHLIEAAESPLLSRARAAGDEIPWIASPRMSDRGTEAALAPLNVVRDLGDVTCGLLLLAPQGTYPLHSHPPQELYLPISGDGRWRYGGHGDFRSLAADGLAYNHPNDLHSIVAGTEPLLALYVLWP